MNFFDVNSLQQLQKTFSEPESFSAFLENAVGKKKLSQQDILSIDDLSDADIKLILETAWLFKYIFIKKGQKKTDILKGYSIINFFCEESTRTRSSFELAGKHLGADTINVSASSSSMKKKGETLNDTARTLQKLNADCIVIRDAHSLAPAMIAKEITAPVINAGDGWHEHPTQGLVDAFTILEEFKDLKGKTMVIIGDVLHSRVAGSLMRIAKRLGIHVRIVAPRTLVPVHVEKVFGVEVVHDMEEGIRDADIVYALRIQLERAAGAYIPTVRDYSKLYCVNAARMPLASKNAIVMHPGPINREVDITTQVMEGPHSRVETQVENGLPLRMALLYLLIKKSV